MNYVLLTNAQQRKTLAVARSLGMKHVNVLAAEETRWATAMFSRYCKQRLVYPDPDERSEDFYIWLKKTLQEYHCDVLFPMDDNTLEVVIRYQEQLEKLCRLPLPETGSYITASDKALATLAAKKAGLNCPKTIFINNLDDFSRLTCGLDFPVIIKPRKSSGSRGMAVVKQQADLCSLYLRIHQKYPFPIIQEYISPGVKIDVCLLFDRYSQLKASFVQKEIRHFPLEKGPSTVQESIWCPELVEKATAFMQKLNWYGVAEVEFMIDPRDGKAKFMEINPRFWGSLYLSILAGVDFPWLLYRLVMDGDVPEVHHYTTGLKCRWLLPGDILHFIYNKNRFAMDPPFFCAKKSGIYDDIISLKDPLPTLGFFLACLRYLPDQKMRKFMFDR